MTEGLALEREGDELLTSGLWNRRRDLRAVRKHLGLELGLDPADVEVRCARTDAVLATGYRRVLLGDHGPYLELDPDAVRWENLRRVHAGDARFYDEWRVVGGDGGDAVAAPENVSSRAGAHDDSRAKALHAEDTAKLYHQIKPVSGQRNPPRDSAWAVANNRPEHEGYAAYVPNKVYVGAFDARVRGRAMPTPRANACFLDDETLDGVAQKKEKTPTFNAGRVAWWRPSEGRGGIVPEGVTGLRNEGVLNPDKAREKGEIAVFRKDVLFGADALVPGEGVWFEEDDCLDFADSDVDVDGPPRSRALNVTGPGGEPTRRACPGWAEAEAAAAAAARLVSQAAAAKKAGGTPAARAAERAAINPWARRAEAERRATASAMRRVARILRDNCARIVAENETKTKTRGCARTEKNKEAFFSEKRRASKASLPAWLAATGRGAVACPVLETSVGALELAGRAAGETVAGKKTGGGKNVPASGEHRNLAASVSIAELTEEGLRFLRRRSDDVVSGEATSSDLNVPIPDDEKQKDPQTENETVSASRRAFDDVLPAAGVGDGPLVVVLPAGGASDGDASKHKIQKKKTAVSGGLGHRAALALRASPRCVGVVLVSAGPDAAVKDAVALAGACAFGTEPFVPTSARAAAADVSTPAVTLTTFERAGLGAAAAMASAAGRAYCWHCGDAEHVKGACPRRGDDGGTVDVSCVAAADAAADAVAALKT